MDQGESCPTDCIAWFTSSASVCREIREDHSLYHQGEGKYLTGGGFSQWLLLLLLFPPPPPRPLAN